MNVIRLTSFFAACAAVAVLACCDGKPSPPDSTSAGMEGGSAPAGRENFGQSSGQGVQPQNLGTSPTPPEER